MLHWRYRRSVIGQILHSDKEDRLRYDDIKDTYKPFVAYQGNDVSDIQYEFITPLPSHGLEH